MNNLQYSNERTIRIKDRAVEIIDIHIVSFAVSGNSALTDLLHFTTIHIFILIDCWQFKNSAMMI